MILLAKDFYKMVQITHRLPFLDGDVPLPPSYSVYILMEKSIAIYFEDPQFRRNMTFNFIVSKIYVDKRSRVR